MMDLKRIRKIALNDLRACYREEGILASHVKYSDFWARDTFWACFGLVETGTDLDRVRKSLELFLSYQRSDGKIPRKICLDLSGLKYIGIKVKYPKPRPIYISAIPPFFSLDENLLLVIVFSRYIKKTKDFDFGKKYFSQIKSALEFYNKSNSIRNSLLFEIGLGNWMDSIFKRGFVLYTNCLWYEAVKMFENFSKEIGEGTSLSLPKSEDIRDQIRRKFWMEDVGYFTDSVTSNGKKKTYFDLAGNVLSILFDIAGGKQAEKILEKADEARRAQEKPILHPINCPPYPLWKVNPANTILGISDYHNGISWSWIEILLIAAKIKQGRINEAREDFQILSEIFSRDGHIHETYFLDGRPYRHLLWRSAVPFAWSSGLALYAISKLENK